MITWLFRKQYKLFLSKIKNVIDRNSDRIDSLNKRYGEYWKQYYEDRYDNIKDMYEEVKRRSTNIFVEHIKEILKEEKYLKLITEEICKNHDCTKRLIKEINDCQLKDKK